MMSYQVCYECLRELPAKIYSVSFDEPDAGNQVLWTDLIISSTKDGINIEPKHGTPDDYNAAKLAKKLPLSVPPYLDGHTKPETILSGTLAGRLARLNQMLLENATMD